jgi:hypothetical protein
MTKDFFVILIGITIGGIITAVFGYEYLLKYMYSSTNSIVFESSVESLNSIDSSNEILRTLTTMKFPKSPVETQNELRSSSILSFNTIQTALEEVVTVTNTQLHPALIVLREMTAKSNWTNIFTVMKEIKVTISENTLLLQEASGELNKLEASKDPKYAEYVVSARNFVNANLDMYKNLNSLLVGKLPTREDVALLNASLQNVRQQSEIYESAALNVVK